MKLSEAILKGIGNTEQAIGMFVGWDEELEVPVKCCAMGAAALAAGYTHSGERLLTQVLEEEFPQLYDEPYEPSGLWLEIERRNDSGESRESIAADLASRGL